MIGPALRSRPLGVRHVAGSMRRRALLSAFPLSLVLALPFAPGDSGAPRRPAPESAPASARSLMILEPLFLAAGDTLHIDAGTRVEVAPGAAIVIRRGGVLVADGTHSLPIVFTCAGALEPGCWEGIIIEGGALLAFGTPTSPDGGCLEAPGTYGLIGGCDPTHSSGVLRHVLISGAATGLRLEGVGAGTEIDFLNVEGSDGNGVEILGGNVALKHALLSSNAVRGLSWSGGWEGKAQFLAVVQEPDVAAGALRGAAGPAAPADLVGRVPTIYNATLLAASSTLNPQGEISALELDEGAAVILRNALFLSPDVAVDVDGPESCSLLTGGALEVSHSLLAGPYWIGSPDPDAPECGSGSPHAEATALLASNLSNVVITRGSDLSVLLKASPGATLEDLRPLAGSAAGWGRGATPPSDGFFDPSATYMGAVEPADLGGEIPWYAGWASLPSTVRPTVLSPPSLSGAWIAEVDAAAQSVQIFQEGGSPRFGAPGSPGGDPSLPLRSILGGDVIEILPSNLSFSTAGAPPGMTRVSFDVVVRNRLGYVQLVTSTFPLPPPGVDALLLFPFRADALFSGDGTQVELPALDRVLPGPEWDGSLHNFFNSKDCGTDPDDCFVYEPFAQPLPPGGDSEPQTVGFYVDQDVTQFRVRFILAADLVNPGGA